MRLTPRQAAARVPVSISLVYQWCEQGLLPHYRLGGRGRRGKILIEETDLTAFLEGHKVTPTPAPVEGLRHIQLPS